MTEKEQACANVKKRYELRFATDIKMGVQKIGKYVCSSVEILPVSDYMDILFAEGKTVLIARVWNQKRTKSTIHRLIGTSDYRAPLLRIQNEKMRDETIEISQTKEGLTWC